MSHNLCKNCFHVVNVLVCVNRSKLVENFSKPNVANFGRSLFGGYCPTYIPDFVLHGTPNDEKLRQCLMSDLAHTVQVSYLKACPGSKGIQVADVWKCIS